MLWKETRARARTHTQWHRGKDDEAFGETGLRKVTDWGRTFGKPIPESGSSETGSCLFYYKNQKRGHCSPDGV